MRTSVVWLFLVLAVSAFATAPTDTNYRSVLELILARADRDYKNLTNGSPTPGGINMMENLFALFNTMNLTGPGTFETYVATNGGTSPCNAGSSQCNHYKGRLRPSTITSTSTLFDSAKVFTYDLIVWLEVGNGWFRYVVGEITFNSGNAGQGNVTFVSCPTCSTIGHITLEWDNLSTPWRIREKLYDIKIATVSGTDYFSQMIFNTTYNPTTGAYQTAMAAKNFCDNSGNADSYCNTSSAPLYSSAYSAMLNGNSSGGYVFVTGTQAANSSASGPSTAGGNTLCLQKNGVKDSGSPTICTTNGVDNFTGITPYSPSQVTLAWSNSIWMFTDEGDTPDF